MAQAAAGAAGGGDFYSYTVDNSARFNNPDVPELSKTFGTATNRKKWTYSTWAKIADTTIYKFLFFAGTTDANYTHFAVFGDYLWYLNYAGGNQIKIISTAKLRDLSAWYHFVLAVDTTQASASDRVKIYVNGTQLTAFSTETLPSQNFDTLFNSSIEHTIGTDAQFYTPNGGHTMNGYLAEPVFVDGQQLPPTDFGEDKNGVWVPKDVSGLTFGNNGFLLDFGNSAALGTDVSGNSNNFTSSGLTSSDQMPDTPTNNFATWNPLKLRDTASAYWPLESYSEGNLTTTHPSSISSGTSYSTIGVPDDTKMYCEIYVSTLGGSNIGIDSGLYANVPSAEDRYLYSSGGSISGPSSSTSGSSYTTGDIIGICIDRVSDEVAFYKNGSLQGTLSGLSDKPFFPFFLGDNNASIILNAGQNGTFNGNVTAGGNTDANDLGDFKYTVPTDALALCTANFPEPTIGPTSASLSDEHFDTVLYTGTGTSQSISTLEFQPDFVWIKSRTDAATHLLFDTIRGASNFLASSDSDAESTVTSTLTSFDTNGFTVGANNAANGSGDDIVAWNWKANGSGVSNTDGATASTVSANTDAGFSIVTYTGTGAVTTVGHGLGVAPNFIIVKARDQGTGYNWCSYSSMLGPTYNTGGLDVTSAADAHPNYWANTAPTSSVFTVSTYGVVNDNGGQMLAYCFAEIEGFSSFGKYTGNGSADGPFIYTGFRPAWFMLKKSSGTGWWYVFDSERNTYNLTGKAVFPNSTSAESDYPGGSSLGMDFLSNGVKLRGSQTEQNGSGTTYIYMAFAENPFKYANAR